MRLTHTPRTPVRPCARGSPSPRAAAPPAPRAAPDPPPADPLTFLAPDIDGDLAAMHELEGASLSGDGAVTSFRNDTAALDAVSTGVALFDRSHCARARVAGPGALPFLHGQLTASLTGVPAGAAVEAVLCTPSGRAFDAPTAIVTTPESALLLAAPPSDTGGASIATTLDKVAFPADGVSVADVSNATCQFVLAGPAASDLLSRLGVASPPALNTHTMLAGGGGGDAPIVLLRSAPLGPKTLAFTLIVDAASASDLWSAAVTAGATPAGDAVWHAARVAAGVPAAGAELDGAATPYEAGLSPRVAVTSKGCFRGAEALAKLARTGGTKRQLWRVAVSGGEVGVGARLDAASGDATTTPPSGPPAGVVTSVATDADDAPIALAYVSTTRAGGEVGMGLTLRASGGASVTLTAPAGDGVFGDAAASDTAAAAAAAAAEPPPTDDREARLAAMAARLAAWQAEQGGGG